MNRLAGLACVAFLILCFLRLNSANAEGVVAVDNTKDCIVAINLARTEGLGEHKLPELTEDPELAKAAIQEFARERFVYANRSTTACRIKGGATPASVGGIILEANGKEIPNPHEIAALIQKQITKGLEDIGALIPSLLISSPSAQEHVERFPDDDFRTCTRLLFCSYLDSAVYKCVKCVFTCSDNYHQKFDVMLNFYAGNMASQNSAHLLFDKTERVGCAVASNCSAGNSVVICKFAPTLKMDESVPFRCVEGGSHTAGKELFEALMARQKSEFDIVSLMPPLPPPPPKSIDQNPSENTNSSGTPGLPQSSARSAMLGGASVFLSLLFLAVTQ